MDAGLSPCFLPHLSAGGWGVEQMPWINAGSCGVRDLGLLPRVSLWRCEPPGEALCPLVHQSLGGPRGGYASSGTGTRSAVSRVVRAPSPRAPIQASEGVLTSSQDSNGRWAGKRDLPRPTTRGQGRSSSPGQWQRVMPTVIVGRVSSEEEQPAPSPPGSLLLVSPLEEPGDCAQSTLCAKPGLKQS